MKQYLWTLDGGRLQYQSSHNPGAINWLFFPGGPGLGSEALTGLTGLVKQKIPGVIWHFDLPNDGSNVLQDKPISNWRTALNQAIAAFDNVILVAHSTPAMYVQTMPELEDSLAGLVLIGTAPDASWQKIFADYAKAHTTAAITAAEKDYIEHPHDETLRKLLITAAKHCFVTEQSLLDGQALFRSLPINHAANELAAQAFDAEKYKATWIPQNLNTLIMAGSSDHITPFSLFKSNRDYQRKNILMKEVPGAGHYPWFENPSGVVDAFVEFTKLL